MSVRRRDLLSITGGLVATALARDFGAQVGANTRTATRSAADRRAKAYEIRVAAARAERARPAPDIATNGDEARYQARFASFTKGLPHSPEGDVDPAAFDALVHAMRAGNPEAFRTVPVGGVVRLVNPQASLAFTLDGPDPQALPLPAPPRFDSAEQAADACELYWQALTRDIPFDAYDDDPLVAQACGELSRLKGYRGPRVGDAVTPAVVFRGSCAGDRVGPYLSQFLLKEVPYGAIRLVPHVRTATPGLEYLVTWNDWLTVQNGAATMSRHAGRYRYIRTSRDLTAYVNLDFSYQPFLTACLVLFGMEGTTDVRRPYKGAPFDAAIPYRLSQNQSGFATLGVAHILDLLARVTKLALMHAWYHKWSVHRWLRPEELGGRVHLYRTGRATSPIHDDLLSSRALDLTAERHKTYLLPQAYPEGCPLHPSYPSGHAVIAGACVTVLKAFFNESFLIEEPVIPGADGLSLQPYSGPPLTVGGELDKLAANISIGRNAAGIHWRYDAIEGMRLGEQVALCVLREARECLNEAFAGFSVTLFDGSTVSV